MHSQDTTQVELDRCLLRLRNERLTPDKHKQLERELDVSRSTINRMFNPADTYRPAAWMIPVICRVLGSDEPLAVLAKAQGYELAPLASPGSVEDLLLSDLELQAKLGARAGALREALSDGKIDPAEASEQLDLLKDVQDVLRDQLALLEAVAQRRRPSLQAVGG